MKRYKITVAYDGSDYYGWQVQENLPSIAQTLQDSFFRAFKKKIVVLGASRTDAGVHALGQVASFSIDFPIETKNLLYAWNNSLPSAITIRSIEHNDIFSPFEHVQQKTYLYHFFTQRPLPLCHRFGWYLGTEIDIQKLQQALTVFVGTHDFRSFCTGLPEELTTGTVRTIDSANVEYLSRYKAYRITIKGEKFLRHMIRRIVGACIEVATRSDLEISCLQRALAEKNPSQILPKAPAKGLLLYRIDYKGNPEHANQKLDFPFTEE